MCMSMGGAGLICMSVGGVNDDMEQLVVSTTNLI